MAVDVGEHLGHAERRGVGEFGVRPGGELLADGLAYGGEPLWFREELEDHFGGRLRVHALTVGEIWLA